MNATAFAVASALASGAAAQALPTGGAFTNGTGTITPPAPGGSSMQVTQTSQRALIDWTSFNIGAGNSVSFTQPAATSVAVNRVGASAGQSTIDGMLSANGHVAILNPNGVLFGPTAIVNVGGLIASTGNLSDTTQFMSSATAPIAITGANAGSVTNKGSITIAGAGLAAFVAPSVANLGTITAASGRIMLGAAQAATVSFNGVYEMAITQGVAGPSISNTGTLSAPGGRIVLSALDAANVVSGLINLEGVQQANRIEVNGGRVVLASDLNAATVTGSSARVDVCGCGQIQDGIDIAATGATVNVAAGTFVQSRTLNVNKSITLAGAGEASTTIDSRGVTSSGGGYAMQVNADNVTLRDFTLYGPTVDAGNAYGIKVQPAGSAASSRLNNFTIMRVTSRGAGRAELDLNGVNGATIDHVTAIGAPIGNDAGTTKGAGIQVTDSANVTIRNSTTRNNAWGGIALFQTNRFFDQQTTGISVEANNVLAESLPLYMQDESAGKNFGALSLQGFGYAVKNSDAASGNDQYTWLQYTLGGAFDFAVNVPQSTQSTIQGWNVSAVDHNFYVGVGHLTGGGTQAMSIQKAVDVAAAGDSVSVGAGTYAEDVVVNAARNLSFADATIQSLTMNANSGIGGTATADGAGGFRFNAPMVLLGDTLLQTLGAGIAFNDNITTLGNNPYALSLDAGMGNITLTSGGTHDTPLGAFSTRSGSFNLLGTLWVTGFGIDSSGPVALSNHSLHAVGVGANVIVSGGDVTGTTSSAGDVAIQSGGNVVATVSGSSIVITADQAVEVTVNAPVAVEIRSSVPITITGSAPSLVVNAPGASVTGDFKKVSNAGAGIVQVNGAKQPPDALTAAANGSRILPAETTIIGNVSGNPRVSAVPLVAEAADSGVVRAAPANAADLLQSGASVELDLSQRGER
ncbi:MAG TPA: filamentous hemagglutinin N-terminal domain-containing protein [Burkholderiales bacterium]|nr:filamentous hemagglutinin N-terminal domain-containing protein [Burkholderiales bacterium]